MIRTKKKKTHVYMLILLLLLGIGFAALAATLKIYGTITIDSAKWDVHFENVSITPGSVTATTVPTSDDTTTTEMTYAVDFTKPGDFYEFTVDMANDGTINAMVDLVTNKTYQADGTTEKNLPAYLKSTVTYNDGTPINKNHLLAKQTSEKIKVRVEFKTDVNPGDLPSSAETTVFKFEGDFKQADENACPKATSFQDDSWETIQCNVKQNTQSYAVGSTKEIELTNLGTHTVRVANNTTPSECSNEGFSQTACGFVVEFEDIITTQRINPYNNYGDTNGDGNRGGWEYCETRTYVNETVYNALPSTLKSAIIDTKVISGHGIKDSENFTTTDKLYLLSTHEIWLDDEDNPNSGIDYYDTAYYNTRQLDYYDGTTTGNWQKANKKYNGENNWWWTRSAYSKGDANFHNVNGGGTHDASYSNSSLRGVSPAFRIG